MLEFAGTRPELGQFRVAESLKRRGVRISPSGVRSIWKRHKLETVYKRLSALGKEGRRGRLTEDQHARLKRAKVSHEALGHGAAPPVRGKPGGRRAHLLLEAAQAFGRRGYGGTTLQDVAEAAGILPGSMYHYFRSKDDLFAQVHKEGFRQINEALDRATDGVVDPWLRLEAAFRVHIEGLVSGTAIGAFTGGTMFGRDEPRLHRRVVTERDAYEKRMRKMVEALPLPPEIDRTLLRLALLGALNWTQIWYKPGKKTPAEIARNLVASIRRR